MDPVRFVGKSADGDFLLLASEDDEHPRFRLPLTPELRAALDREEPEGEQPEDAPPDHHVRVVRDHVDTRHPRPPRRVGGLAPGAFERATSGGPQGPSLRGVRALITGAGALAPALVSESSAELAEAQDSPEPAPDLDADLAGLVRTAKPQLSTGEIQSRLRAGQSVEEVARAAGAPADWVARLDETIARERLVLVSQMLHEKLERPGIGYSEREIADALVENLGARGVNSSALETGWSASRSGPGPWRVRFAYSQGGIERQAEWTYDPKTRTVRASDESAARLAWVSEDSA